jgi:crotonobetainyl-CoA:carnitine CoA-transferase CaiB-like acyl-CoA transferase
MLGGDPSALEALTITGDARVLPSVFDVTGFAAATVGVASLAAAELLTARNGSTDIPPVTVDTRAACAAFQCEALFEPIGWDRVGIWDPIAGDYEAADGWIRLHTNYASHRVAALRALGLDDADRDAVTEAVSRRKADELEGRVVDEGGAAAAMHARDVWAAHPHGAAVAGQTPIAVTFGAKAPDAPSGPADRPLSGVRVLDLTRVLAGPFGTRFLAAWGADVLRIDPPGFEEVPAIVPEATAGKRTAFLDLRSADGHARFLDLVARADVLVHGYRPGALAALGLDAAALRSRNPALIISEHDAYGWTGPWAARRGFDSLVQMSCGIAAARGADRPRPLPCQALDHGTGFLLAAAVCRALTHHERSGASSDIRGALVGAANVLCDHPDPDGIEQPAPEWTADDLEDRATDFGPARAVAIPGTIGDLRPRLDRPAGPLGRHEPAFA